MAANDVELYGPYDAHTVGNIVADLEGTTVGSSVANGDNITVLPMKEVVYVVVVKAA
jgi:hypothetical protein